MKYRCAIKQNILVLAIMALGVSLSACSEMSREDYRDEMTDQACENYYGRCGEIGPGKTYASRDECEVKIRAQINDMWPASKCDDGRLDEDKFDSCMSRAGNASCTSLLDWTGFLVECSANKVCTAPRS